MVTLDEREEINHKINVCDLEINTNFIKLKQLIRKIASLEIEKQKLENSLKIQI